MKCSKCGAPIEEGKLFCSKCGQEVQLVPDYDTLASRMFEKQKLEREEEERRSVRQESVQQAKKKKTVPLLTGVIILILCIGVLFGIKAYMDHKNYNSFEYQIDRAETAYSNKEYEKAMEYVSRASDLNPDSDQAALLLAEIYTKLDQEEEAISVLQDLIEQNPEQKTAYGQLIRIYDRQGNPEAIKELLDQCESENIKKQYSGYISEPPVFNLPSGDYDEPKELELISDDEDAQIFYTLDGSDPDEKNSETKLYMESDKILLEEEGTVTVKAVAVNQKGIRSNVVENTYVMEFKRPDPPKISPSAGEFDASAGQKILVIVPDGCTAYYAFDEKPTTSSNKYTGPVDMPAGSHTFYAILVNEYGKESYPSSALYVVESSE